MVRPSTEYAPLFDWSAPRSRKVVLLSFLAASAALHGLCFYVFQIIYPPTVALLPPPARVHIITPDSEEGRVLLRWIEAEDPALSSTTLRPPDAAVLQPPTAVHVPSYSGRKAQLRDLPPYAPDLSVPNARPPGPVPSPRPAITVSSDKIPTSFRFSQESLLGQPVLPPMQFRSPRNDAPEVARFRVAVDARGAVRHCFLVDSSDDTVLDEQARQQLLLTRFPAIKADETDANGLYWANAIVEWGNDIATPALPATESPAP